MKRFILYHNRCFPSANLLRNFLNELSNEKFKLVRLPKNHKIDIRYGNTDGEYATNLNSKEFISLCVNKFKTCKLLNENEIKCPVFYSTTEELIFPCLIRTSLCLSGGKGINLIQTEEEFHRYWRQGYYWTPFLFLKKEYRVHVLGGKVVKIFEKILNEEQELPIKNNDSCSFVLKSFDDKFEKLKEICNKIYEITKGEFFAVDIGWNNSEKKYYVFELNSAPGLNSNTAELYAKFILSKLGIEIKEKDYEIHWSDETTEGT